MVLEPGQYGAISLIYVCPEHGSMRMLVASFEDNELDLVRMDLNGARLAEFLDNPHDSPYRHSTQPE
jgi:hypothetical protein